MANRRMFSRAIVGSARFLMMPVSARLLYYDLGMQADDEGVVEAFTVIRMTGAAEDDLRALAAKSFVTIMNEDLVTLIMDWKENNYIQKDRFNKSIYHDLADRIQNGYRLDTECIQSVSELDTQVRLGKGRLGKVSTGEVVGVPQPPAETLESFADTSFRGLSPIAMQELTSFKEDLPEDIIRWAICQSIDGKIRTWAYCKSILNRCLDMGLKTMNDVLRAEDARKKQKKAAANPSAHGYQEHSYTDADFMPERSKSKEEIEEEIRKAQEQWYLENG